MPESMIFKKKPEKKELPQIKRIVYHPAETFYTMVGNMNKKSESVHGSVYTADAHIQIAANAEKITPVGNRFYNLILSLKG